MWELTCPTCTGDGCSLAANSDCNLTVTTVFGQPPARIANRTSPPYFAQPLDKESTRATNARTSESLNVSYDYDWQAP
eukprot:12113237-Heterocapsa_arctica.AAC.1